jgi:5-methylcytosine-specific restriction endonuclease McrA
MLKEITLFTIGIIAILTIPYVLLGVAIIWYFVSEHNKQQLINEHNNKFKRTTSVDKSTPYMKYEDYQKYLLTPKWKHIRAQVLERDNNQCKHCQATHSLHCHHLTYKRLGDENLRDLITLCSSCHTKIHKK